ncbi:MAG: insulinase family protein, partial [Muribaculaceae bacterium]|nr:insulinase family protein [Muribaculaceae bacterium]
RCVLETVYTVFTNLSADEETFNVAKENIEQRLKNAFQNPQMIFSNRISKVRYDNNPLMESMTPASVEAAVYPEMMDMLHSLLSNAADYTFVFTGNIDEKVFRPLMEQYLATLPAGKVKSSKVVTPIVNPTGQIVDKFDQPMQTPSVNVFDIYSGNNLEINVRNEIMISMLGDILRNIYTETLREEEGGTYGASVRGNLNYYNKTWNLIYSFQTNAEQQETLINRAQAELMKLLENGADMTAFTKVKEAMLKQEEINSRKNSYWDDGIVDYLRGYDMISDYRKAIEETSLESLNDFMKGLYNGENRIQVIMVGTPLSK